MLKMTPVHSALHNSKKNIVISQEKRISLHLKTNDSADAVCPQMK